MGTLPRGKVDWVERNVAEVVLVHKALAHAALVRLSAHPNVYGVGLKEDDEGKSWLLSVELQDSPEADGRVEAWIEGFLVAILEAEDVITGS